MILVMMFDGGSQSRKFSLDKNSIDVVISHTTQIQTARVGYSMPAELIY